MSQLGLFCILFAALIEILLIWPSTNLDPGWMRSEVQDLEVYLDVNLLLCTSDNLKWKFFKAFLTEKNLKRTYSNYPALCTVVGGTQMQLLLLFGR